MAGCTFTRRVMVFAMALVLVCGLMPRQALAASNTVTINEGETGEWSLDLGASGTITSDPANGTAQIKDGKLVYTPNAGFTGTDTVTLTETKDITLTAAVADDAPRVMLYIGSATIRAGETVTGTLDVTWGADGAAEKDAITVNGVSGTDNGTNITFTTDYGTLTIPSADYSAKKESLSVSFTANSDLSNISTFKLAVACTDGDGSIATPKKTFTVVDPNTPILNIPTETRMVDEEDLSWGTGANRYPNSNTYSGTFTFDCYRDGNGTCRLTIGSQEFKINTANTATDLNNSNKCIYSNGTGPNGSTWKLTINSITNGTVSYTYELLQNRTHNSENAAYDAPTDTVFDTIPVTTSAVSNGETLTMRGNLVFGITDDSPLAGELNIVDDSRLKQNALYGDSSYSSSTNWLGADRPQSEEEALDKSLVKINGQECSSISSSYSIYNSSGYVCFNYGATSLFTELAYYVYDNRADPVSLYLKTDYAYTKTDTTIRLDFTDTDGDTATATQNLHILLSEDLAIANYDGNDDASIAGTKKTVAAGSSVSGTFTVKYVAGETVTLTAGDNQVSINADGSGSGAFPISCHSEEGYGEFKITSVTPTTTADNESTVVGSVISYTYTPDASNAGKTDEIILSATSEYGRTHKSSDEYPNKIVFNITSANGGSGNASLSAAPVEASDGGAEEQAADKGTATLLAAQSEDATADSSDDVAAEASNDSPGFLLIQAAYADTASDEGAIDGSVTLQGTTPDFTVYETGLAANTTTGQTAGSHAGEDAYPVTATYTLGSEYSSNGWQIASVEAKGSKGYGTAEKKSDTEVAYTLSGALANTSGDDLTEDVTVTLTRTTIVTFNVDANDEADPIPDSSPSDSGNNNSSKTDDNADSSNAPFSTTELAETGDATAPFATTAFACALAALAAAGCAIRKSKVN